MSSFRGLHAYNLPVFPGDQLFVDLDESYSLRNHEFAVEVWKETAAGQALVGHVAREVSRPVYRLYQKHYAVQVDVYES